MIKYFLQKVFNVCGYSISKHKTSDEIRFESFYAQKQLIHSNKQATTIFDVGAYIGDISFVYNKLFPHASIYAFEPFPSSYETLCTNTHKSPTIHPYNIALSEQNGEVSFYSNSFSPTNSLLASDTKGADVWGKNLLTTEHIITVPSATIDSFCETHSVNTIDILKLDVQGAEYKVLAGAKNMLLENRIHLIYMEIICMPTYQEQKELGEILLLLKEYGFSLYNFYNYSYTESGQLRQVDAIFIPNT